MQERMLRVLVVEDNPADARLVREMLADVEGREFEVHCADTLVGGLDALAQHEFDIALVDLSLPDSQGLATFETIQRHAGGLPVVVFTGVTNEMLALTAVARGAQDYLVKGRMTSQALVRVLQYSVARSHNTGNGQAARPKATVFGFLGSKGGVGTTTVATQFAIEWRLQTGQKVLLADLDTTSSSAEFLIRSKSKYSILNAATNLHRLDVTFWNGIVSKSSQGIDVLQCPGALSFTEQLSGERVRHVLRFARGLYQCIVLDLGRLNLVSINLLDEITSIYLVSTGEFPALYEANRVIKKLADLGLQGDRVQLVMNRMTKSPLNATPNLEKALGYSPVATLSDFAAELADAYIDERMLDDGLGLRRQIGQLVSRFLGGESKAGARGLRRFLGLARP